MFLVPSQYLWL